MTIGMEENSRENQAKGLQVREGWDRDGLGMTMPRREQRRGVKEGL